MELRVSADHHLIAGTAASVGHRRGPWLQPVVRSTLDRPEMLMSLLVVMLIDNAVRRPCRCGYRLLRAMVRLAEAAANSDCRRGPRLRPVGRTATCLRAHLGLVVNNVGRIYWSRRVVMLVDDTWSVYDATNVGQTEERRVNW